MKAIDSNILLRIALEDDTVQLRKVRKFFRRLESRGEKALVLVEVLVEVAYVLTVSFKMSRERVVNFFHDMLESELFLVEHEDLVWAALDMFERKGGFTDELIAARSMQAGADGLFSFDKGLIAAHPGFVFDDP